MRVLYLSGSAALGGAERFLLDAVRAVGEADPAVERHVAVPGSGPLVERLKERGVIVHGLPMPAALAGVGDSGLRFGGRGRQVADLLRRTPAALAAAWGYAGELRALVRRIRPDVVHSNGNKFHLLTRLAGVRGTAVVWHVHDFLGERAVMRRGLAWAVRRVRVGVAISRAVRRDARPIFGRVPVRLVVNGVDLRAFVPGPGDGAELDRAAGLPPAGACVRAGLVATYARWKGQDVFLEAARRVAAAVPGVRFYVVGGPIYLTAGSQFSRGELERLADVPELRGRVGFVPFQGETAPVHRALDVVVHASTKPEPFGLTIAEAMACGRAVVVSAAGGAAELFEEGRDGLGVRPGDAAGLAGAVLRLVGDADLRGRLGAEARRTAGARFDAARLGPELLAVYRSVLR